MKLSMNIFHWRTCHHTSHFSILSNNMMDMCEISDNSDTWFINLKDVWQRSSENYVPFTVAAFKHLNRWGQNQIKLHLSLNAHIQGKR
jgi:hypothetical protein